MALLYTSYGFLFHRMRLRRRREWNALEMLRATFRQKRLPSECWAQPLIHPNSCVVITSSSSVCCSCRRAERQKRFATESDLKAQARAERFAATVSEWYKCEMGAIEGFLRCYSLALEESRVESRIESRNDTRNCSFCNSHSFRLIWIWNETFTITYLSICFGAAWEASLRYCTYYG